MPSVRFRLVSGGSSGEKKAMKSRLLTFVAVACLTLFASRSLDAQIYNVRLYGALPEGKVLATACFRAL